MYRTNTNQKKKQIQYSNGTVLNAFIYLKFKDEPKQIPKKIKYPSSVSNLMKIAKNLFLDVVDVQSIFTKNGKRIEYIDDVIPGDTLYVSPISENPNEEDEIKINKRKKAQKEEENNKLKGQASYNKLFGGAENENENENERVRVKVIGNPHLSLSSKTRDKSQIPTFKKYNENASSNNGQKSKNQFQSSSSFGKGSRKRSEFDDITSESSENDANKNTSESINSKSGRNQQSCKGKQDLDKINKHDSAWSMASEDERQKLVKGSADLSEIFQKVLHEDTLAKKVPESLFNLYNEDYDQVDKEENLVPIDFYEQLVNQSKVLDFYWIKKGIELFDKDGFDDSEIYGLDEIRTVIRHIISMHRKPIAQTCEIGNKSKKSKQNKDAKNNNTSKSNFYSGMGYNFNLAIIGPRKSGKSTFLSLFARELLFEFAATESLKKHFILNLDMSKYIIHVNRPDLFFHDIVDATMVSLQWNCPCYTPYIQSLTTFFKSITDDPTDIDLDSYARNPPKIPANFKLNPDFQYVAAQFQSIANQMTYLWDNDEKYLEWTISVLFFADSIAHAVGIGKVFYIVDNIDLFDLEVNSSNCSHFKLSNNRIFLADIIKQVLSTGNYVISCKNQFDFFRFMEPITDEFDSTDFSNKIEYESTLDLININDNDDDDLYQNKIISAFLDLEDEEVPIYMSLGHTGGIPTFVFLWKEINKLFDEIEQYEESSIEYQEIYTTIFSQASELLYQLFTSQDGKDISSDINIVKVKRSNSSKS